jgi:hypothetical protein
MNALARTLALLALATIGKLSICVTGLTIRGIGRLLPAATEPAQPSRGAPIYPDARIPDYGAFQDFIDGLDLYIGG